MVVLMIVRVVIVDINDDSDGSVDDDSSESNDDDR